MKRRGGDDLGLGSTVLRLFSDSMTAICVLIRSSRLQLRVEFRGNTGCDDGYEVRNNRIAEMEIEKISSRLTLVGRGPVSTQPARVA